MIDGTHNKPKSSSFVGTTPKNKSTPLPAFCSLFFFCSLFSSFFFLFPSLFLYLFLLPLRLRPIFTAAVSCLPFHPTFRRHRTRASLSFTTVAPPKHRRVVIPFIIRHQSFLLRHRHVSTITNNCPDGTKTPIPVALLPFLLAVVAVSFPTSYRP